MVIVATNIMYYLYEYIKWKQTVLINHLKIVPNLKMVIIIISASVCAGYLHI